MKFKIYGVSRESGKDVELVLEGDTKEAAEKTAYELNILVYVQKTQEVVEHEIKATTPVARRIEEKHSEQLQSSHSRQTTSVPQPVPTLNVNVKSNSNSLGIASIVLGVVALLICWIPFVGLISVAFAGVGLVLSLIGLVLSIKRSGEGIGYPIAGIVLNGLPLAIVFLITSAFVSAFSAVNDAVSRDEYSMPPTQQRASETDYGDKNEVKPSEIIFVTVTNKRLSEQDYSDYILFDFSFNPTNLSKTTRAVKGTIVFADLFSEVKFRISYTIDDAIHPNTKFHAKGIGFRYNEFIDDERWINFTDLEDMQIWFVVDSIIYQDGKREDF